jgi:hypothetical protein
MELVLNSIFFQKIMKSHDYVRTNPKMTISIAINLTFNIYYNLAITNGYIGVLK